MLRQRLGTGLMAMAAIGITAVAAAPQEMEGVEIRYDISVQSTLEMGDAGYVLPPGEYVIREFDMRDAHLFALYKQGATEENPLAIIDAWQVPYYPVLGGASVTLKVEEVEGRDRRVLRGWESQGNYWRIRDVAAVDESFFADRPTS